MISFLLFDLCGPLAAWGDIAVGEHRPSGSHPSKSAIVGLVAAAMGIDRNDEDENRELGEGLQMGVRVNRPGQLMRDFHTIQVPRGERFATRRDELQAGSLYTILSTRDYYMDVYYTVAVWLNERAPKFSLESLSNALKSPRYTLYLGRKSCPVTLPLAPEVVRTTTLKDAFDQRGYQAMAGPTEERTTEYFWEALDSERAGMSASMTLMRRDVPLSRRHWQFSVRDEYFTRA